VLGQIQLTIILVYVEVYGAEPLRNSETACKILWSTAW